MNLIRDLYVISMLLMSCTHLTCQSPIKNDTTYINSLIERCKELEGKNNDSALIYIKHAMSLSEKIDNKKIIVKAHFRHAFLHYVMGKLNLSLDLLSKTSEMAYKYGERDLKISSDMCIAIIYDNKGNYAEGYGYLIKIFKECDSLGLGKFKSMAAVNMTKSMLSMKRWKEGVHLSEQAIEIATKEKDFQGRCISYNNLAIFYRELNMYNESENALNFALTDAKKYNFTQELERYLTSMCALFQKTNVLDSALYYGLKSVELSSKNNNSFSLILAQKQLAEVYLSLKNYKKATLHADISLAYAMKHSLLDDVVNIQQLKYNIALSQQNISEIKLRGEELLHWKDSLSRMNFDTKIANIEDKFQNVLLKKDLALKATELKGEKSKRIAINFSLLALAVFGMLMFYAYHRRKSVLMKLDFENKFGQQMISEIDFFKKNIASTLHDDIGQQLILIKQYLKKNGTQVDENFNSLLDEIIDKVRGLSRQYFPHQIEYIDLSTALCEMYDMVEKKCQLKIIDEYSIPSNVIDLQVSIHVYRIVQELITNTIKHSKASVIWISMITNDQGLHIKYKENFSSNVNEQLFKSHLNLGWKMIIHRLDILGGSYQIKNEPNSSQSFIFQIKTLRLASNA